MSTPTIYAALLNRALDNSDDVERAIRMRLSYHFDNLGPGVYKSVLSLVREAYVSGVRDGFAQGIAAQERPTLATEDQ